MASFAELLRQQFDRNADRPAIVYRGDTLTFAQLEAKARSVAARLHDGGLERGDRVVLRPLTENDWDVLLAWSNDPDVLWFAEGDRVASRSLAEVQAIYRGVSVTAYCFIIEYRGQPVGECWLQAMNLQRVIDRYPGLDVRRIDIALGAKALWSRGLGTEAVRLLIEFGFECEGCDAIFEPEVADYNTRSRRVFEKLGFRVVGQIPQPTGAKARVGYDLLLTREAYLGRAGRVGGVP